MQKFISANITYFTVAVCDQAVVGQGIVDGEVPLLQLYLSHQFGAEYADLSYIVSVGLAEAVVNLRERELGWAEKIFRNLVSAALLLFVFLAYGRHKCKQFSLKGLDVNYNLHKTFDSKVCLTTPPACSCRI